MGMTPDIFPNRQMYIIYRSLRLGRQMDPFRRYNVMIKEVTFVEVISLIVAAGVGLDVCVGLDEGFWRKLQILGGEFDQLKRNPAGFRGGLVVGTATSRGADAAGVEQWRSKTSRFSLRFTK